MKHLDERVEEEMQEEVYTAWNGLLGNGIKQWFSKHTRNSWKAAHTTPHQFVIQ